MKRIKSSNLVKNPLINNVSSCSFSRESLNYKDCFKTFKWIQRVQARDSSCDGDTDFGAFFPKVLLIPKFRLAISDEPHETGIN